MMDDEPTESELDNPVSPRVPYQGEDFRPDVHSQSPRKACMFILFFFFAPQPRKINVPALLS
jgi:hypothetical protein